MNINTNPLAMIQPGQRITEQKPADDQSVGFGDLLKQAIDGVNSLDQQSADMKTNLVTGQIDDIAQVLIAAEKSNIAFQLTVQIRNKVIEAYQEIMRMQV